MNEETIAELVKPIKEYINNNLVEYNDIPVIVQSLFPDEDKVRQIAAFLRQNVQSLKIFTDDKLLERTRQILTNSLNSAALDVYYEKLGTNEEYDTQDWIDDADEWLDHNDENYDTPDWEE